MHQGWCCRSGLDPWHPQGSKEGRVAETPFKKKKVIENGGSSKKKTLSILFHENLNISSSFTPTSDIECSPFQFLEVLQQAVCVQILENTHLHC
jgi:hypothetical protein